MPFLVVVWLALSRNVKNQNNKIFLFQKFPLQYKKFLYMALEAKSGVHWVCTKS